VWPHPEQRFTDVIGLAQRRDSFVGNRQLVCRHLSVSPLVRVVDGGDADANELGGDAGRFPAPPSFWT
jgi:hypothetical protein